MVPEYPPAVAYLASQSEARANVRKRWKADAGELLVSHLLALSSVYSLTSRFLFQKSSNTTESIDGRLCLSAQFMQGVDICETSISEGLYSQAAALVKQELETLVAIDEFERNERQERSTPNIGRSTYKSFGPIYGDLNSIAHVSIHHITHDLVLRTFDKSDIRGASLVPLYDPHLARMLYGNHTFFITQLTKHVEKLIREMYGEGMSDEEKNMVFTAIKILLKSGIIESFQN